MPITVHRVILFILFPSFLCINDKSRTKILTKVIHTTFITTFAESFKVTDMSIIILGIESSCDDTSAAIIKDGYLLSNVTASQAVHMAYGGVVPELASRAHQQNIVPVVDQALKQAGVKKEELSAVAFTRGPGLMGSLLV